MSTTVYLIHFDQKLRHAQHYIGFTTLPVELRMKRHRSQQGAAIIRALERLGITWSLVRIWAGEDRNFERKLKNRKNARFLCPTCTPKVITA